MAMTDCMVDLETTGTDPANSAIIQIAAVQFNYQTGEIGPVFNRCLMVAPLRFWDEDTRKWWSIQNKDVFNSIIARQEPPEPVIRDFLTYATTDVPQDGLRLWAKPTLFEFPFLASYFAQYGLPMPFSFRYARDLNTYMAAMAGGAEHQKMEHIPAPTNAHDALTDVFHQLKLLFAAKEQNFGIQDAEFEEIVE